MDPNRYSTFPKAQGWSFTIRWFKVIPRTLFVQGGGLPPPPAKMQSLYSIAQTDRAEKKKKKKKKKNSH